MAEINPNQLRILITGVSGLVGRVLSNYLRTTYPTKYQVFGVDQHMNISTRYQAVHSDDLSKKKMLPVSVDKFFECDITDRTRLHQIIKEQRIQNIIHLAGVLESHPNLETISRVNIEGARNVFEAPGVRRVIHASSVRTVFGYLAREPYRSIFNETFDDATMLPHLRKLTVKDDPPLPDLTTIANKVYDQSKITAEQIANEIVKTKSKSIISLRLGRVDVDDEPASNWLRTVWLSYRDLCSLIDKALEAPLEISGTYFAISNNHRLWVDLENAKQDLGYVPQDGAEK